MLRLFQFIGKRLKGVGVRASWLWLALVLGLLAAFPFVSPSIYYVSVLTTAALYAVLAMSYDLLIGYTGIVSFGHALFFGIGAYGAGILMRDVGLGFFPALVVVVLLSALMAVVVGLLSLRVSGVYFSMVTLAFAEFFHILVQKLYRLTGGDDGFSRIPTPHWLGSQVHKFYFVLVFAVILFYIGSRLVKSPVGSVWMAIRENETRAKLIGYNTFFYKLLVMVISGMMAGLTGGVYAVVVNFAYPGFISVGTTINVLLMVIIGGVGSLYGSILGALIVRSLGQILSSYFHSWLLMFGLIYVVIVLFFPAGIIGSSRAFLARRQARAGLSAPGAGASTGGALGGSSHGQATDSPGRAVD